jgi:hypothetical protein
VGNLREEDILEDPGIDGKVGAYTKSIWLRLGTGDGVLVNAVMNLQLP